MEANAPIEVDELRRLNRCLDNAIADSITDFNVQRYMIQHDSGTQYYRERLGVLVHEARNLVTTAKYAMTANKAGHGLQLGAADEIVSRCLNGLGSLIQRSIEAVRTDGQPPAHQALINLSEFIADLQLAARLEAQVYSCLLSIAPVEPCLAVYADRDMLLSALTNLLQNAFKFTALGTQVALSIHAASDRIRIEVEDNCGGWPSADAEHMFQAFNQCGANRSGLGLGLSICRRCVEANQGAVSARNIPGTGCIFTIELPRHYLPRPSVALS